MSKSIFIVSGDASGDVYGAQLINALKRKKPDIEIAGLGGDRMAETGMVFLYNLVKEFSVMGFIPVVLGIPKVMRFLEITLDYFDIKKPDLVVLIDYPGFNLYLATHTKKRNIPVAFYVTPQIWAWAPWRIKKIKKLINKMLVIFPFEVPFYKNADIPVEYVGHPLLDKISLFKPDESFLKIYEMDNDKKILTLLPGSRKAEIKMNLPVMLWCAKKLQENDDNIQVIIALGSDKHKERVNNIVHNMEDCLKPHIIIGKTYDCIHNSHVTLVTSGTACLETAMLGRPLVVIYRVPKFHKWIVTHTSIIQCKFFSLPNIIADREIISENLIDERQPEHVFDNVYSLWKEEHRRSACFEGLKEMKKLLKEPGASERTADAILEMLSKQK